MSSLLPERGAAVSPSAPKALYSAAEELAHVLTHGLGAVLAVAALVALVIKAALYGNVWHVVACSVYGATLVLMYTGSTLYHSATDTRAKSILRVIDHSLIFLMIAGTYTPFTLVTLRGPWGWSLFALTWTLTVVGLVFKLIHTGRYERLSLAIYLAMGWSVLVALQPLIEALPIGGLLLLAGGGLTYSLGALFYAWRSLPFNHAIWHGFVLLGGTLHYFAIFFFVVPSAPSI